MVRLAPARGRVAPARARVAAAPKRALGFYRSAEWLALVARRKGDADYRAALDRAGPGERLILDHVVELKDGGAALDPGNTQWLTFGEHQVKTARERRRRAGLG